ncbi:MAG: TonB-dependent receptor [Parvularculaceae bacterium]|nr:TonB-dependent receptor [Parvularculaceae bacterium]
MIRLRTALLCAVALSPISAFAQSTASPEDAVVVSAVRAERPAAETGSTVTVIDAADLQRRQYAFVADALRDAAGVAIARNGSAGGFASARLRGGASGQTLVIIDGVTVNDPAAPQGGFNFANLDLVDIARIEILRGPQSILYGADAIGGVISITTAGADGAPVAAFIEGGSFGTVRGGATATAGDEDAFLRASVSGTRTDGISRADNGAETDGFRSIAASLRGKLALGDVWSAEGAARFSDSAADIDGFPPPTFLFADTLETEDTQDYSLSGILRHADGRGYKGLNGALTLAYSAIDRRNVDQGVETFTADGERLTADYVANVPLSDRVRMIGGAEVERTAVNVSGVDESATSGAIFGLVEAEPIDRLVVTAGARRDEFSNFDGATTARVAAAWSGFEGWIMRASWGEGFRAPTLFELNFDQFGIVPNPNLRPERATGIDAGIERTFGGAEPFLTARATFFRTRVRDQIDFDFLGNGYFNIDRTRSRGVEVEVDWRLAETLQASMAYTLTDAVDLDAGTDLLRVPRHKGTAVIDWTPAPALTLSASVIVNGAEADVPAANAAFVRLDLRAAWAFSDRLAIYGRLENAADADYQDVSGFGEPGASAFGGIRVKL